MSSKSETAPCATETHEPSSHLLVAFVDGAMVPYMLPSAGTIVVGRSSACELPIDHPSVSREHSRITIGDRISIEDLGSRNGTRVRGVPLATGRPVTLHTGDVVECGVATLLLRRGARGAVASASDVPPPAAFVIGPEGRSLRAPGAEPVNLGRRGALRRVLLALAETKLSSPGAALSVDTLLEAGWPGEKMGYEAGVARVYTTIQRLRGLGLQPILLTRDDGYLLDASVDVRIEA